MSNMLTPEQAQQQLEAHLQEIIAWHFSPESGCPFRLDWPKKNFDPRAEIKSVADFVKFPHFQDEWLRDSRPEVWVPKQQGQALNIFDARGTTGMQKQRIGWTDYKTDYSEFSDKIRGSSCYFIDLDPSWVKKLISNTKFDEATAYAEHVVNQAAMILKHRKVSGLFTTPKVVRPTLAPLSAGA